MCRLGGVGLLEFAVAPLRCDVRGFWLGISVVESMVWMAPGVRLIDDVVLQVLGSPDAGLVSIGVPETYRLVALILSCRLRKFRKWGKSIST